MFKIHTQVRHGNLPWINSGDMQLQALDNMSIGFGEQSEINFDIDANDFEALCKKLKV